MKSCASHVVHNLTDHPSLKKKQKKNERQVIFSFYNVRIVYVRQQLFLTYRSFKQIPMLLIKSKRQFLSALKDFCKTDQHGACVSKVPRKHYQSSDKSSLSERQLSPDVDSRSINIFIRHPSTVDLDRLSVPFFTKNYVLGGHEVSLVLEGWDWHRHLIPTYQAIGFVHS